jgi:hypothetical protein
MTENWGGHDTGDRTVQRVEMGISRGSGLLDTQAEIGGDAALHDALDAWQHEQDRLLNRTWRRPGGLARPAGL